MQDSDERRPWVGNRSTKRISWPAMRAMFAQRDQLRRELWHALLLRGSKRRYIVEAVVAEPTRRVLALAARRPARRRDEPLVQLLLAQSQVPLRLLTQEILRDAQLTAPKTAAVILRASQAMHRIEDRLVTGNIALAIHHAHRWEGHGVPVEDLVQEASFGLQRAVVGFEVERGFTFSTYATPWVVQTMRRYLHNEGTIRIPVHMLEKRRKLLKLLDGGQTPEQAAKNLQLDSKTMDLIASLEGLVPDSLDVERPDARSFHQTIVDPNVQLEEQAAERADVVEVERLLEDLGYREQEILTRRAAGDTLGAVGDDMGISRERVRQLEARAVREIHEKLVRDGWVDRRPAPASPNAPRPTP